MIIYVDVFKMLDKNNTSIACESSTSFTNNDIKDIEHNRF